MALVWLRTYFARYRDELFHRSGCSAELEQLLDAVELLLDVGVIVSRDQDDSVKNFWLHERLFPVRLVSTRLDWIANDTGVRLIAHGVRFHAVLEVFVAWAADVLREDGRHLLVPLAHSA